MNNKERFKRAHELLRGLSAQADERHKFLSKHAQESRPEDTKNISSITSDELATRQSPNLTPADDKPKYEQHTTAYKDIAWWLLNNDKDRFVQSYNRTGGGKPIMFKTDLLKYTPKIPYGRTLNSLLEIYADIHPDMVVQDAETGDFYLRKIASYDFRTFIDDFVSIRKEQLKNSLTADAILQEFLFTKDISEGSLDKMIREFAKQNPNAVMSTPKNMILDAGRRRSKRVYALGRAYLQDFFAFAGLTVVGKPVVEQPLQTTQPKIDPFAPDYPTDPTLKPLSDQEMDAIASRLAGQNIADADLANDAILAEIKRIADGRDDR